MQKYCWRNDGELIFILHRPACSGRNLAMAGDLGGSIGPAIVGKVTQYAGDSIRVGMGVGLIVPTVLILMLAMMSRMTARSGSR